LGPIKEVMAAGGQMIIATGGAVGPYLEHVCSSVEALATAYKIALDTVGTTHLDVDVEAPIDKDLVTK
jgi:chitinase